MVIGATTQKFKVVFKVTNVKLMMPTDYHVAVGFQIMAGTVQGIARFVAVDGKTTYWVAVEEDCEPSNPELRAAITEAQRKSAERYAALEATDAEVAAREEPA
jgi:hypothetical protein